MGITWELGRHTESQARSRPPESASGTTSSEDIQAQASVRSAVLETPHLKCNIFVSIPHYASHGRNFEKIVLSGGKQRNRIPSRKTTLFRHSGKGRGQSSAHFISEPNLRV